MNRKVIITELNSKRILMDFADSVCESILVLADNNNNLVGNVYVGRVENVVKNINAAFIEIKKGVKCYYSLTENKNHIFLNQKNNDKVNIGDKLLIQVNKDAIKTKPASATSKIEIPGKYIVVSLDVSGVLISSKLKKNKNAQEIQQKLEDLLVQNNYKFGFIIRTNSSNVNPDIVINEAKRLSETLANILKTSQFSMFLDKLYTSTPDYCTYINNISENELDKIITDDIDIYNSLKENITGILPDKLQLYKDDLLALNKLYSMETILKHATDKKVWLKSGGYLVIEQTEAMTVIDVNSGKQTSSKKNTGNPKEYIETTFLKTNIEAADELSRQIRQRNISGIIIVDFINMAIQKNNDELMSFLSKLLKQDPVTTTVIDITKLGLIEITRKNNGKCLIEQLKINNEG